MSADETRLDEGRQGVAAGADAEESASPWEEELERWRSRYLDAGVVYVDVDRVWLYAHNTHAMIVKEYVLNASGAVSVRGRLVYCGPAVLRTPAGYFVFANGRVVDTLSDLNAAADVLLSHLAHVRGCFDVDIGQGVGPKVPAQRGPAALVVARTPFELSTASTVDIEGGRDLMGLLRTGDDPAEVARVLKAREGVLRHFYGENYRAALAFESLYVASALVGAMKEVSKTAVSLWVYSYGPAGLGKSILARNLVEMWCSAEECEEKYALYVAGPMNENRFRNAVDIRGPPFVADEQDRESVVKLLKMLGTATSDTIGVHASRYGHGFGAVFKVRRSVFIVSNVPPSDAVARVDPATREAAKRRLLAVPWAGQRMDKDTARRLLAELRQYTPPLLPLVSAVYRACRARLAETADTLELAKVFWRCASELFGVDFSERLKTLEWVESIQGEEKAAGGDELYELWAMVKAYYKTSGDAETLLKLLDDRTVVEYTERGAVDKWGEVFRRICGGGVSVENPNDVFIVVARCLYNVDVDVNTADTVLNRADVELVRKIAALVVSGRYPWVKAPSWLIPHKKREVAGVPHVRDRHRNIYRYDLVAEFLVLLYKGKEEEGEGEPATSPFTSEQEGVDTTSTTSTIGSFENTISTLPTYNVERAEGVSAHENLGETGSTSSTIVLNSNSTNVSQMATLGTGKVENRKTSNTPSPPAVDVDRVVEIVASELRRDPAEVRPVVEKAVQYFDTFPSVGSIRAVEDLRSLARADVKTVRAVLDALVAVGALERAGGGAVYNYRPRTSAWG